jgi:superfamily II DNA or RNA helicase
MNGATVHNGANNGAAPFNGAMVQGRIYNAPPCTVTESTYSIIPECLHRTVPSFELRPYQADALKATLEGFGQFNRQLVVLPTGAGKTILFGKVAESFQPGRVLILAHREELLTQACDKVLTATGIEADTEKAELQASLDSPIVVASVQTQARQNRLDRFPRDHFGLIVVDEAHHVLADSYKRILDHFEGAKVLGVTATPDRGDQKLLSDYFENVACELTLVDLIRGHWLAPIRVKSMPLEIDLRSVQVVAGDYDAQQIGHALDPHLEAIADIMVQYRDRKTLVFLPLISCSERFAQLCRDRGIAAEHRRDKSRSSGHPRAICGG